MKRWLAGLAIRWKLTGALVAVLILTGAVCGVQLIVFSDYLSNYNRVLDGIARANTASGMLKTELDAEIREVVSGRLSFAEGNQYGIIDRIERQLDDMRKRESEAAMLALLDTADKTLQSLREKLDVLGRQYEKGASVDEQTATMEYILIMTSVVEEELQGIIRQKLVAGEREQARISDGFRRGAFVSAASFVGVLLLAGLAAWFMSEAVARPLRRLGSYTAQLAEGNLAVERLEGAGADEIGKLCGAFNGMAVSLTSMVSGVHESRRHAFELTDRIGRSVGRHREVGGAAAEATGQIALSLQAQNSLAQSLFRELEQLTGAFHGVMGQAETVGLHAEQSQRLSAEGALHMRDFAGQFAAMRLAVHEAADDAGQLLGLFAEMSGLLDQIKRIAGETNMLALNAGIEAARGGGNAESSHGGAQESRSFGVIARRMRELAGHTAQLAGNADDHIRSVGGKIADINRRMIGSQRHLEESRLLSEAAQRLFADIAGANGSVRHNAERTMADMEGALERLRHISGNVSELVRQSALIEAEMARMTQLADRQGRLLDELDDASGSLILHNRRMDQAVARFVLPDRA